MHLRIIIFFFQKRTYYSYDLLEGRIIHQPLGNEKELGINSRFSFYDTTVLENYLYCVSCNRVFRVYDNNF
jgi:hypothetical protein